MPPLFEEMPWLLLPIIIATVEAWSAVKHLYARRRAPLPDGTWMVAGENDIIDLQQTSQPQ